jgi:predicted DNA-binding transcriptional regulator AlpA
MRAFIVLVAVAAAVVGCTVIMPEAQAFLPTLPAFLPVIQGDHGTICSVPLLAGYLSTDQCAKQLGVTRRTLWRWRKARTGPPITQLGGAVMYRIAAVEQWLRSREMKMVRERHARRADDHAARKSG